MTLHSLTGPQWSTSCLHDGAGGAPPPSGALDQHLRACLGGSRRLFVLRCGADSVHAFVVARFVSTLALLALLATLGAWLW